MRFIHTLSLLLGVILFGITILLSFTRQQPVQTEWIIFKSFKNQLDYLYRMLPDGTQQERLTTLPYEAFVDISPNGDWLIIKSQQNNIEEFYRINISTRELQQLTFINDFHYIQFDGWTPDKAWLLFSQVQGSSWYKYRVKPDGKDLQRLPIKDNPDPIFWSPDSQWLIFERGSDLYRIKPNGDELQNLTYSSYMEWFVGWTPDDEGIIFRSRNGSREKFYEMSIDGSRIQPFTNLNPRFGSFFTWSPDSEWGYFYKNDDVYRLSFKDNSIEGIFMTGENSSSSFLTWTTDKKWMLFYVVEYGGNIYKISEDGSQIANLTSNTHENSIVQVSQDGETLAVWARKLSDPPSDMIHLVEIDTGKSQLIDQDPTRNSFGGWSADGQWVYYSSSTNQGVEIFRQHLKSQINEQITNNQRENTVVALAKVQTLPFTSILLMVIGLGLVGFYLVGTRQL